MAQLRGGQALWTSQTVNAGDKSPLVEVGTGPYVSFFIENQGAVSVTLTVEAAATADPSAGRNALDGTADGGLFWGAYVKNGTAITITVTAGSSGVIDLSPFGPQFVRLHRTDANGACELTAIASSFGPN